MTKNDGDLKCILLSEIFQFDCMISIICHFGKMQNYGNNKKSMIFSPSDQWWWHVHVTTTVDTNHKH